MQILVYFRSDLQCITVTCQPLVDGGGLNLLPPTRNKNLTLSTAPFQSALYWYKQRQSIMQLGCCFTRQVYHSEIRMVYVCVIPFLWFAVQFLRSWFIVEWSRQKYMVNWHQMVNSSVLQLGDFKRRSNMLIEIIFTCFKPNLQSFYSEKEQVCSYY